MTKDGDDYCPALNMWCEEAKQEVDRLESENAALWAFVRSDDAVMSEWRYPTQSPIEEHRQYLRELSGSKDAARDALRKYEAG